MSKESVLVTGGAGYIGSHVCKALAREGYIPVTYDSFETGHKWAVCFGPYVEGSILDKELLISTLKQVRPIAVFHLASLSNPRQSHIEALSYYKNNVIGTYTLLEALSYVPIPYFLFASSASVYQTNVNPLQETTPLLPLTPYGRTKLACEMMIADFCKLHPMCHATLRYFNAAGADVDGNLGESHFPETHLIPLLIQAIQKENRFTLFGKDHPTKDGTTQRDYVHVEDLANAHLQALEWMQLYKKNISLNLGSGKGHTILEILHKLEAYAGKKASIQLAPSIEEAPSLVSDITLARDTIGWNPTKSLEQILETAWNWHNQ